MIIDCISDLHGHYPTLQGGDLLIVGGDLTAKGKQIEYGNFSHWLWEQQYRKKIIIAGNHDNYLNHFISISDMLSCDVEYLEDSGTEFEGLKIWGSPWTRSFEGQNPHCMAFTLATEAELAKKWELIPKGVDILITHSPCFGIFDQTIRGEHVGSTSLAAWRNEGKRPKLHVCGHVHEGYGMEKDFKRCYVNASYVNERYQPVNKPIRVIL